MGEESKPEESANPLIEELPEKSANQELEIEEVEVVRSVQVAGSTALADSPAAEQEDAANAVEELQSIETITRPNPKSAVVVASPCSATYADSTSRRWSYSYSTRL